MRRIIPLFCVVLLLALMCSVGLAQIVRTRVYSNPRLPSEETLRKLNLRLAWSTYIPMDGKKDGFQTVKVIGTDVFAMTRSNLVVRLDAESGQYRWRNRLGKPYTMLPFLGANSRGVYVSANAEMYGLDRGTGEKRWNARLPAAVSAGPAVDEERLYLPTSTGRLFALRLPDVIEKDADSISEGLGRAALYGASERETIFEPHVVWSNKTNLQLAFPPVQSERELFLVGPSGIGIGFDKEPRTGATTLELYSLSTEGKIRVAPKSFGDTAYVGSDDAALYAIKISTGRLRWRHVAGTEITQSPVVLEKEVFVTSKREGMACLDRITGEPKWRVPQGRLLSFTNPRADRFLAANNKFVYVTDATGRLLIIDRKRGVTLSALDITDYRLPVSNEVTDRLYLCSNDGLIACFHDIDLKDPIRHRKTVDELESTIYKRLKEPVLDAQQRSEKLLDFLTSVKRDFKITLVVSVPAFRAAGAPDPRERIVKVPRGNKVPLGKYLQSVLDQVNCTFDVIGASVQIVPGRPKE